MTELGERWVFSLLQDTGALSLLVSRREALWKEEFENVSNQEVITEEVKVFPCQEVKWKTVIPEPEKDRYQLGMLEKKEN